MKYTLIGCACAMLVIAACKSDQQEDKENKFYQTEVPSVDVLKTGIKELEDSLTRLSENTTNERKQIPNIVRQALIEKLKLVYRHYPEDKTAPLCMDKVHQLYSIMGAHEVAVSYADSLLERYPDYENKDLTIFSIIAIYDDQLEPRDTAKVREYYHRLFKAFPNMSKEEREDHEFRLKHLDMTIEELAEYRIQNMP